MKVISFLIFALIITFSYQSSNLFNSLTRKNISLFKEFMLKFNKSYQSEEEFEMRFHYFLEFISKTNGEFNEFSDLSQEEFKKYYLTLIPFTDEELKSSAKQITRENIDFDFNSLPESFDWRTKHVVTEVKNQKQCGSCWAFSAVANIESVHAIKYNKLNTLSEQQIMDCDDVDHGCAGGFPMSAFAYVKNAGGLQTEKDYEYQAHKNPCKSDSSKFAASISGYIFIQDGDDDLVKAALIKYGPLSAALDASMLGFYIGGIYEGKSLYDCSGKLNHAVLDSWLWSKSTRKKILDNKKLMGPPLGRTGIFQIITRKS
jgi:C1A family cysteine protease